MAAAGNLADVRAWAREQGLQVGDRGRLPSAVLDQYAAAHPSREIKKAAKVAAPKPRSSAAVRRPAPAPVAAPNAVRRAVPAASPAPAAQPVAPTPPAREPDNLRKELELVRGEVGELRKHLDEVLARVVELEQPRGLFSRTKAKR